MMIKRDLPILPEYKESHKYIEIGHLIRVMLNSTYWLQKHETPLVGSNDAHISQWPLF
jgi:hypothetical protein